MPPPSLAFIGACLSAVPLLIEKICDFFRAYYNSKQIYKDLVKDVQDLEYLIRKVERQSNPKGEEDVRGLNTFITNCEDILDRLSCIVEEFTNIAEKDGSASIFERARFARQAGTIRELQSRMRENKNDLLIWLLLDVREHR